MDFQDWQRDMARTVEDAGFTQDDYREQVRRLKVLRFHIDKKGENIVSQIDGVIAFVDRRYTGERVIPDDVWLCSVVMYNNVYYAMPLRKITSSMIMGLSDEIRDSIIDSLWRTNRAEFEQIFRERYREETYARAYEEAKANSEGIIAGLQEKVEDLKKQVEHSRMVIGMRESEDDGGIVLTSDPVETVEVIMDQVPVREPMPAAEERRPSPWLMTPSAPGMPEMRHADGERPSPRLRQFRCEVLRTGGETLRSDVFEEGKYFVHINTSRKFLVIRRHDYGSAICIGNVIRLEGLEALVPYGGERQALMAEFNERYGGLLVHL